MRVYGRADELSKLIALHNQGFLSQAELEDQKRLILSGTASRPLRRRLISLGVASVVLTCVLLATNMLAPSPPSKVALTTVSLTQSQVQTAIAFAMIQVDHSTYNERCLQLMGDAYARAGINIGSSSDPITYWAADPKGYAEHAAPYGPYGNPPAGAILFWGATQWTSDGHAALSLGNGSVVSSAAYPYSDGPTNGLVFSLSAVNPKTYHYLGYLVPGDMPTPAPAPAPVVTTTTPPQAAPAPTPAGQSPAPAGTAQLQPAAGATSLQSPGTVSVGRPPSATTAPPADAPVSPPTSPSPTPLPTTTIPVQSPPPTPPTFAETVGGVSNTWTDFQSAGGNEGPQIPSNETVQIACKLTGFRVADGNTWWYRIASGPWNNGYYVSADAFYNNGATSGSLLGTPFVDPNVPNC